MFGRWTCLCIILSAIVIASSSPIPSLRGERDVASGGPEAPQGVVMLTQLSPDEVFGPELATRGNRDKRKLNWILDIFFWKYNTILDFKTRIISFLSGGSRRRPVSSNLKGAGTATTEEPPIEFEGNRISLVLPDELFGSAFTVVTDVSKIIGSVIQNSARRTQVFFESIKPIFRNAFGIRRSTSAILGDRLPSPLVIPSTPPPLSTSSTTTSQSSSTDGASTDSAEGTDGSSSNDT